MKVGQKTRIYFMYKTTEDLKMGFGFKRRSLTR